MCCPRHKGHDFEVVPSDLSPAQEFWLVALVNLTFHDADDNHAPIRTETRRASFLLILCMSSLVRFFAAPTQRVQGPFLFQPYGGKCHAGTDTIRCGLRAFAPHTSCSTSEPRRSSHITHFTAGHTRIPNPSDKKYSFAAVPQCCNLHCPRTLDNGFSFGIPRLARSYRSLFNRYCHFFLPVKSSLQPFFRTRQSHCVRVLRKDQAASWVGPHSVPMWPPTFIVLVGRWAPINQTQAHLLWITFPACHATAYAVLATISRQVISNVSYSAHSVH